MVAQASMIYLQILGYPIEPLETYPGLVLVYMVELDIEGQCLRKECRIVECRRVMRHKLVHHGIVVNAGLHWLLDCVDSLPSSISSLLQKHSLCWREASSEIRSNIIKLQR